MRSPACIQRRWLSQTSTNSYRSAEPTPLGLQSRPWPLARSPHPGVPTSADQPAVRAQISPKWGVSVTTALDEDALRGGRLWKRD